jgi:DNA-binding PadR family transcriptional regulator
MREEMNMGARSNLGEFEQLVLLAILQLADEAYGPSISELLERALGREVSRGALYSSLSRLEQKGFVEWKVEATSSQRGGSRNRRFSVTEKGLETLRDVRAAQAMLSRGLESELGRAKR